MSDQRVEFIRVILPTSGKDFVLHIDDKGRICNLRELRNGLK